MSNNLDAVRITASQASKYATANDALGALDAAITEVTEVPISTTSPVDLTDADVQGCVVLQLVASSPPPAGAFTVSFPAVKRGLMIVENKAGQTASLETAFSPATTPISLPDTERVVVYVAEDGLHPISQSGGGSVELPSVTLGTLPSAAAGLTVFLTDIKREAYSDGSAWFIKDANGEVLSASNSPATRQIALTDYGNLIFAENTTDIDIEIPLDSTVPNMPERMCVFALRGGTGKVNFTFESGIDLIYDETSYAPSIRGVGEMVAAIRLGANQWMLSGPLEAL